MNTVPLVSIVIPAFNPRFFEEALRSALEQSYEALEVLVSDDCPTDEIRRIVESLTVPASVSLRYWRNPQSLGFARNLRQGVSQARGEFVKVLCDDDRLFVEIITQQARVLVEHAGVNLVQCHRVLADASNYALPSRVINCQLTSVDTLFKGGDMLALLHASPLNILGNFSSALMRTADLQALLVTLVQDELEFSALLDFAVFICLLRRGDMVMLRSVLSAERLHPGRLSKQHGMAEAADRERQWLLQMMKARGGEDAPAEGWVRSVSLDRIVPGQAHEWVEVPVLRGVSNLTTFLSVRVGSDSESYDEFYADWLSARQFTPAQLQLMPRTIARWPVQPRIAVIVSDPDHDRAGVAVTLRALEAQLYRASSVVLLSADSVELESSVLRFGWREDNAAQLNDALAALPQADWVYLLRAGDRLVDSALLVLAERIAHTPAMSCAYSDESALVDGLFHEPVFKPDFNIDLMRSYPYVGRALAFSRHAIQALGGFDQVHADLAPHDLLWRLVESHGPQVVEHIAEIQLASTHGYSRWLSGSGMEAANRALVRAHLERIGVPYRVRPGCVPLINRIDYASGVDPLVSVVIATGQCVATLQRCIETLIEKTAYTRYEILLLDDGRGPHDMLQWLDAMGQLDARLLRVLRLDSSSPAVLGNHAARHAQGEYLLFASAELLFINADWLDELLNHARRPEVGVTGAKTFSRIGSVVNFGLVMGMGGTAASPFAGEAASALGYMQRLQACQNWSAVSGDCLMVRKAVFEEVGGFDVDTFVAAFHDVDLCLRIGRQGYLVVATPYSNIMQSSKPLLLSAEQVRQRDAEQESLYQRWLDVIARDPAYNPSLSLGVSGFSLNPGLKTGWNPFCARSLPSVLAIPINGSAVGYYRAIHPLTELQAAGRVEGKVMFDFPSLIDIQRMAPDVIILQCQYGSSAPAYIASLKKHVRALKIYELDDYVIKTTKKNSHARNNATNMEEIVRDAIASCDRVVVTTQALKDALSSMHHDIRIVPNMLPPHLWQGLQSYRGTSARPRVGWAGGTSHTGDLEVIVDVVRQLADEVDWVFFGMCTDELRPYVREFHSVVSLQSYPAKLASLNLDLALAPLEFHIFNDCKSNLRLLEYGACGYPVICTDTMAYDGFLPCTRIKTNTTEEWIAAIRQHLNDPKASYRMGDQLREAVLQNYMLSGDNLRHWEWGWLPD